MVSKLDFFLIALKPVTVLSGQLSAAPTDPYMTLTYAGGQTGTASAVGTSGAPVAGNTVWVGTSAGGQERGTVRLRSWTPSGPTGTAGSLSIAETDDLGPNIQSGDYISILLEWRLWGIAPRLVQHGTQVTFYEDYDIPFGTSNKATVNWRPVAVVGPPAVAYLSGPTQVQFVGDRSFALAPGATITGYLWTAHGSNELTSTSQGTEASPVTFTWNAAGQYLVSLRVTDSNGNTHTAYTWVFVVDPDNPAAGGGVYTEFDAIDDVIDFQAGGGECSFTVHGTADVSQFPRECLVVHACRGTQTTPTGSWPFRTNVLFVGYIVGNSIRQDPVHNTTSFRATTIDGLAKNLSMHAVSLRDEKGPRNWTMAADITVDRAASFLWRWRSTLAQMTPVRPLNYTAEIKRQDFGPTTLYTQLQEELVKDAWAQVVSDHQGTLHLVRDFNLMTTTERAAATTRKTLHKGIWIDQVDIEERPDYAWPVRKVKMSGIRYPGGQAEPVPLFSEAPGDVHKAFGREDAPGRLILTTQADLNTRCGHALARQNYRWHTVRARFVNDGSFIVAPQEIFPAVIEPGDNNRGLSWTPDLIPRRIRRSYNHQLGTYVSEVEFEPSVTGPAGVTVVMPTIPPRTPTMPTWDPPPIPPWTPPINPMAGAAAAGDLLMGVYWTNTGGATWERRVNGLNTGATGTSQLMVFDLIWDPWWWTEFKHATSDPEQAILLATGPGFLVESQDAGKFWTDLAPYLSGPPNSWADSPAATGTAVVGVQLHADIHAMDTFYGLFRWQNASGSFRGWIAKTADRWKTQTWQPIGAPSTDGTYYYAAAFVDFTVENDIGFHPAGTDNPCWTPGESGTGGLVGPPDDSGAIFSYVWAHHNGFGRGRIDVDMGVVLTTNASGSVQVRTKSPVNTARNIFEDYVHLTGGQPTVDQEIYVSLDGVSWTLVNSSRWDSDSATFAWGTARTIGARTFRYLRLRFLPGWFGAATEAQDGAIDSIRVANVTSTSGQLRPLAMDLDSQDGSRLYVTCWDGTRMDLRVYDSDLTLQRTYDLGLATDAQITVRQAFAVPRSPHLPGQAHGNMCYVFGSMPSGTFKHLGFSSDAGATFADKGNAAWTSAQRIGGFLVDEPAGMVLYAFLNAASPRLWRSPDAGASWVDWNSLPFNLEHQGCSRHWGSAADILIGAIAAGVVQAARQASPYNGQWIDATGPAGQRLPVAADSGGGLSSIVWI